MASVVVTGGAGFIGSNLALELQRQGHHVVVVDDFSKGHFQNLIGFEGDVIPQSVLDVDLSAVDADMIFHQAAITDTTVTDQRQMLLVNTHAFKKLIEFAVQKNVPFVYASSAGTYGDAPAPTKEEHAGVPKNVYGFSKWMCDMIARRYMRQSGSQIVGLRYFNVFGPREKFKGNMASMVWQLAQQMVAGKNPRIFRDGEQKRDQVYVKDVVTANLLAVKAKESCIVNVGSGKATSFNRIIEVLNEVLGKQLQTEYFENPYAHYQGHTEADLTRASQCLGYKPEWAFEDGVKDYMREERLIG